MGKVNVAGLHYAGVWALVDFFGGVRLPVGVVPQLRDRIRDKQQLGAYVKAAEYALGMCRLNAGYQPAFRKKGIKEEIAGLHTLKHFPYIHIVKSILKDELNLPVGPVRRARGKKLANHAWLTFQESLLVAHYRATGMPFKSRDGCECAAIVLRAVPGRKRREDLDAESVRRSQDRQIERRRRLFVRAIK